MPIMGRDNGYAKPKLVKRFMETLLQFDGGCPLEDTSIVKHVLEASSGNTIEDGLMECRCFQSLYNSIKDDYRPDEYTPILVTKKNRDTIDGLHRTAILTHLGWDIQYEIWPHCKMLRANGTITDCRTLGRLPAGWKLLGSRWERRRMEQAIERLEETRKRQLANTPLPGIMQSGVLTI